MKLERIRVERLPGIDQPFSMEELSPGLNLVIGPNGSGKSSLCRAIRASLWPDAESLERAEVSSWWRANGSELLAELRNADSSWQRDGVPGDAPALPDEHLRYCFTLGLTDLLELAGGSKKTDEGLADRIRVEMAGGFRINSIAESLFKLSGHEGIHEATVLRKAQSRVAELESGQRDLADEEERLKKIEARLELARRAQTELSALEAAGELAEKRLELDSLRARIDTFPALRLDGLNGNELEKVAGLRVDVGELDQEIEVLETALDEARQTILDNHLPGGPLEDDLLDQHAERIRTIQDRESELRSLREARAGALAVLASAQESLGTAQPEQRGPNLEPADLDRVEDYLRRTAELTAAEETRDAGRMRLWAVLFGCASVAAGLLLTWWFAESLWSILVGLGVGVVGTMLLLDRRNGRRNAVERRALEGLREEICSKMGVDPGGGDLRLYDFARALKRWRDARADLGDAEGRILACDAERSDQLAQVNQLLTSMDCEAATDSSAASACLRTLERRSSNLRQALLARQHSRRELDTKRNRRNARRAEIDGVFEAAGIVVDDDAALAELLQLKATRDGELQQVALLERDIAGLVNRLGQRADLDGMPAADIAQELEQKRELAAELPGLATTRGEIRTFLGEARGSTELEEAIALRNEAWDALAERHEGTLLACAGRALLEQVAQEHELGTAPEVLRAARRLFVRFTRGRYELQAPDVENRFHALDCVQQRGLGLSELSDATRAQLLLAARLAFATQTEHGESLPLFLDEALATSDRDRFHAIATSLLLMAREEGRQLFYFGARSDEIDRWLAACAAVGAPEPKAIDLAQLRGAERSFNAEEARAAIPERIPAPAGLRADEYAELLGVPRPDPFEPVEAVHLFHVLRHDLELLHRLLDGSRIETVGQWRALVGAGVSFDAETRDRVAPWTDVIAAFLAAHGVGRGKPVLRETLEASGAVSNVFIDRIDDLCRELRGDAVELLQSMRRREDTRVHGFYNDKIDDLERYLDEKGYLDRRERLDRTSVATEVLRSIGRHVEEGRLAQQAVVERVAWLWQFIQANENQPS